MGSYEELERSVTPTPVVETAAVTVFGLSIAWLSYCEIQRYRAVGTLHPASFGHGQPFAVGALFLAMTVMQAVVIRRSFTEGVAKLAAKTSWGDGSIDFSRRTNPVGFWVAVGVQVLIALFMVGFGCCAVLFTR